MHQTLKDTHIIREYPDILVKIFIIPTLANTYVHSSKEYTKDKNSNVKNTLKKEKKKIKHIVSDKLIKASQNSIIGKILKIERVTLQNHRNKNIIKISICKNIFYMHSGALSYSGLDA